MPIAVCAVLVGLVLSAASSSAAGQPADDGFLGGPAVEAEAARLTLVERDYEGRLRRLEVRPEVAAIDLIGLGDEARADADAVVEARAAEVEAIVFDNLLLLTKLQTARTNLDDPTGELPVELRREMMAVIRPLVMGEPLVDQIAATMPEDARETYRALVTEYTEALADAGPENPRRARQRLGRGSRGGMAARFELLRVEVAAAYQRGSAGRTADLDAFLSELDLTPEQEGPIRQIIMDLFTQSDGEPSEAARAEAFREAVALLEPEQRRVLMDRLREAQRARSEAAMAGSGG